MNDMLSLFWRKKARTFVKKTSQHLGKMTLQWANQYAPAQAARMGEKLFLTPVRYRPTRGEKQVLARGRQLSLQVGPQQVEAWSWGQGPRVLLVHGWSGRGGQFYPWVDVLTEAGFEVVLFDAPGHGQSTGSLSALTEFIRTIHALEAHLGGFYAMIGHSLGGAAALLAAAEGVQVQQLITLATPSDLLALMKRNFEGQMGLSAQVRERIQHNIEQRFGIQLADYQPLARATGIEVPVLVVHDLDDREVPWAEADALQQVLPAGQWLSTKGWGHYRILRNAGLIVQCRAFLMGDVTPLGSPAMDLLLGTGQKL